MNNSTPIRPTLKGSSISYYNNLLIEEYKKHNITEFVIFESEKLKGKVGESQHFMRGLIAYLSEVDAQLNTISNNDQLKTWAFQIIAELGTLIYPNAGTCYSLIPQDLVRINWSALLKYDKNIFSSKASVEKEEKIKKMFDNFFKSEKYLKTLICIISASLSIEFTQAINKSFVITPHNSMISEMPIQLKASSWLSRLTSNLKNHIIAINFYQTENVAEIDILPHCKALAVKITNILLNNKLFSSDYYKDSRPNYKVTVYIWQGSNYLLFPKQLTLPMRCYPQDWIINKLRMAESGGFLLSEFTNISYQGYLDSKSLQMHNHRLYVKNSIKQINKLQKVKFTINDKMINFINKYQFELTDTDTLLITDKWIHLIEDTLLSLNKKWSSVYSKAEDAHKAITTERITKQNETLRNQDMLDIAKLFKGKTFYWPAVHDFRSRIYRIGHLNIQQNTFVRSLIRFHTNKALTNRKKNSHTAKQFDKLLQEVLVEEKLIKKWDTIFGDRLIHNDRFEELLMQGLLAKELSFIQVAQLLSIREGAYHTVGIFYDASASAYQIMGVLNGDEKLCQLTNVLKSESGQKQDLYQHVLENVFTNLSFSNLNVQDAEFVKMYIKYFEKNADRALVKSIVMPLIYGKTSIGFAEDNLFLKKVLFYPQMPL